MKLEGSLDAFSLSDIFQLLSRTNKTGVLHLRRAGLRAAVHLNSGQLSGVSSDVSRQSLARRVVGLGHLSDSSLADAVARVSDDPAIGLARALQDARAVDDAPLLDAAQQQALDAVFDLLRWPDGDFSFVVGEPHADDVGLRLPVGGVLVEAAARVESWTTLGPEIPADETVFRLAPALTDDPALTRDEWTWVAMIDGRRSVAELVAGSGRGEFAVVSGLVGLVRRGLIVASADNSGEGDEIASGRREELIGSVEGIDAASPAEIEPPPRLAIESSWPESVWPAPESASTLAAPIGPATEEPVTASSEADGGRHATETPVLEPDPHGQDGDLHKSMLLRLIAGARTG